MTTSKSRTTKSRYNTRNASKNPDELVNEQTSSQENIKKSASTSSPSKPLQKKRSLSVVSTTSLKKPRGSQSPILPPQSFFHYDGEQDDEKDADSPQESFFAEESVSSPINIDESTYNISRVSSIHQLPEDDEEKVERIVRSFVNVFVQNPVLWSEFKEVVDSTSAPITIPSIKGKEVQRRIPLHTSQVTHS